MSQLYTIVLRTKRLVFDGATPFQFREEVTEARHTGVPAQLVQTWKRTFPKTFVSAEEEVPLPAPGRNRNGARRPGPETTSLERPKAAKPGRPKKDETIAGSDYADAINAAIGKEAAE